MLLQVLIKTRLDFTASSFPDTSYTDQSFPSLSASVLHYAISKAIVGDNFDNGQVAVVSGNYTPFYYSPSNIVIKIMMIIYKKHVCHRLSSLLRGMIYIENIKLWTISVAGISLSNCYGKKLWDWYPSLVMVFIYIRKKIWTKIVKPSRFFRILSFFTLSYSTGKAAGNLLIIMWANSSH